jgi:uncharacterized protein YndB with AHSA1/START domain
MVVKLASGAMTEPVSVTMHIDAPPDTVYALVSDLPRMGEWSPENTGGKWVRGATGAATGARFKGTNKNGSKSWSTTVKVVEATPGKAFVFDVVAGPMKISRWAYRIAEAGGGCDVTEEWMDRRPRGSHGMSAFVSGVKDRSTFTRTSIQTTLENLKAAAEA